MDTWVSEYESYGISNILQVQWFIFISPISMAFLGYLYSQTNPHRIGKWHPPAISDSYT